MSAVIDLTGRTFGRLRVVERRGSNTRGQALWACVCGCDGREVVVMGTSLTKPDGTRSCGCLKVEAAQRRCTHGATRGRVAKPEYSAFHTARQRCTNPNDKDYGFYGGRGIRFLVPSYEAWIADVGDKPGPEYMIDRIDNNGHYEVGNLRWVTRSEQMRNRRKWKKGQSLKGAAQA